NARTCPRTASCRPERPWTARPPRLAASAREPEAASCRSSGRDDTRADRVRGGQRDHEKHEGKRPSRIRFVQKIFCTKTLRYLRYSSCLRGPIGRCELSPHVARDLDDQLQLGFLLIDAERVAFGVAGEAALRAERELFDRHELRRLVDAPFDVVLVLER